MENYEIKQAFKNLPDAGLPNNEPVMCREYEQCDGCNYPAHGFICWHGDGKCLRTEMQEVKKSFFMPYSAIQTTRNTAW